MTRTLTGAFVAFALAGAIATGTTTVNVTAAHAADVGVSFNLGDVAIGYSDGYWDHEHHWHKWQSTKNRSAYQHSAGPEYHAVRHTSAPNQGWHDNGDHH